MSENKSNLVAQDKVDKLAERLGVSPVVGKGWGVMIQGTTERYEMSDILYAFLDKLEESECLEQQ